jgi:hypothetical protein
MSTKRRSEAEILKEDNERLTNRLENIDERTTNIVSKIMGVDKKILKKNQKKKVLVKDIV